MNTTFEETSPAADWLMEPTTEMVADDMARRGGSFEEAKNRVEQALRQDAKRLAAAMPTAVEELESAHAEVTAAQKRENELLEESLAALNELEQRILRLGLIRHRAVMVQRLARSESEIASLGQKTLDSFVLHKESPSPRNESEWRAYLDSLSITSALAKHVPPYVEKITAEANAIAAAIRRDAQSAGIDLKAVVAALAARNPTVAKHRNSDAFDDLQ